MTKISSKLIFFGSGQLGLGTLQALLDNYEIEAIITKPSQGHREANPVVSFAISTNITCLTPSNKQELVDIFDSHEFESRCGVVVDYGLIIPTKVIDNFELGIINSHFSLLPEWRGADPISFALLSGQTKTGVSLMLIEPSLDTGPLLAQKAVDIESSDDSIKLSAKLLSTSNKLLLDNLDKYLKGSLSPIDQLASTTQKLKTPTFSRKLTKPDGQLDPNKPASVLEREIRAFIAWPKSRLLINNLDVIVTKTHAIDLPSSNSLVVGSIYQKDQKILLLTRLGALIIDEVKPAGKSNMSASAFLAGHKITEIANETQ